MKTIINKTPHPIYILGDNNSVIEMFPKSNGMARITTSTEILGEINGIPISRTTWGEVKDLPDPTDNVYYIVSQLVKSALPERDDLLVPVNVVRDDNGNIIGSKSLDLSNSNTIINL